jgi:GGDEF domain-containing protein
MSFEIKNRNFRLLGQTLSNIIRKSDHLGRLEAETFVLLMPQTSAAEAAPVCCRLQDLLMAKSIEADGLRMDVKLSIVDLDPASNDTADNILKVAQAAMKASLPCSKTDKLQNGQL